MKIIVTHNSPDWDAITSVWLIKRFLQNWENAELRFVPAGSKLKNQELRIKNQESRDPIEKIGNDEVIHVDTGLGPLDHHQTSAMDECAASRTWNYIKNQKLKIKNQNEESEKEKYKDEAISRIVKVVVGIDHFQEVFWDNPMADYHEFSLLGLLDGLKLENPDQDEYYAKFGMVCLDATLRNFENRIWAEGEIAEHGVKFKTRFGDGIGFETINDDVLHLAQKMGYVVVVRKDPRKGYVRVKARPSQDQKSKIKNQNDNSKFKSLHKDVDLTLAYEKLSKMDPGATWFLHISKKMLLNGTVKNPKMKPTRLSLEEIIKVLEQI